MIINLGFYKRRPELTHKQFAKHWTEVHAPLIRSIPNIGKYVTRYVQHHVSPDLTHPMPFDLEFDGFSETWFPSVEAREELIQLPFFLKEVIDNEAKFIDMSATRIFVVDEQRTIIRGMAETEAEWVLPAA